MLEVKRTSPSRWVAILAAARQQFAFHGFRGAALRSIAGQANVSLTLLDHHFGNKAKLLDAVIEVHRPELEKRTEALGAAQLTPQQLSLKAIIELWTRFEFEIARDRDGELFLQLVAQLSNDEPADLGLHLHDTLARAAEAFVRLLQTICPDVDRADATAAQMFVSASAGLIGSMDAQLSRLMSERVPSEQRVAALAGINRFLTAGIAAALERTPESG